MTGVVTAHGEYHGRKVEATVLNPGAWFGKAWLVYAADCFDPRLYVVEADSASDAIEAFVDDPSDPSGARIDPAGPDAADYGWRVSAGDRVGGVVAEKAGWQRLDGTFTSDPEVCKYLREPGVTDSGVYYDSDNIMVCGTEAWPCDYSAEWLDEPVSPPAFCASRKCETCGASYSLAEEGTHPRFCRPCCASDAGGEEDE